MDKTDYAAVPSYTNSFPKRDNELRMLAQRGWPWTKIALDMRLPYNMVHYRAVAIGLVLKRDGKRQAPHQAMKTTLPPLKSLS